MLSKGAVLKENYIQRTENKLVHILKLVDKLNTVTSAFPKAYSVKLLKSSILKRFFF